MKVRPLSEICPASGDRYHYFHEDRVNLTTGLVRCDYCGRMLDYDRWEVEEHLRAMPHVVDCLISEEPW